MDAESLFPETPPGLTEIMLKLARGNRLTKKQQEIWDEWSHRSPEHLQILEHFKDPKWLLENMRLMDKIDTSGMWENVEAGLRANGHVLRNLSWWRKTLIHWECKWECFLRRLGLKKRGYSG